MGVIPRTFGLILLLASAPVAADHRSLSASIGADFSTGRYGRADSTDVTYVPFIARYEVDRWLFKATLPYVRISGPGTVVGGDRPVVIDANGNATRRTVSGPGDIVVSAAYSALVTHGFFLDVTGKTKFGTASESEGLGTGRNDYSVQVDVYKALGSLTGFGGLGYRWYGDPPGTDLRNVAYCSLGAVYKASRAVSAGAVVDYRQPILAGRDPIVELTPFVTVKAGARTKVQIYGVRGFTDASADWGGVFVITQSF